MAERSGGSPGSFCHPRKDPAFDAACGSPHETRQVLSVNAPDWWFTIRWMYGGTATLVRWRVRHESTGYARPR